MLVQVYEVRTEEEARAVAAAGVDHVGILVGKGDFPRELSVEEAAPVVAAVPPESLASVLVLGDDMDFAAQAVEALRPSILHLGAAADLVGPAELRALKVRFPTLKLMRSIAVTGPESVDLAEAYQDTADFLLLDSHKPGDAQIGAQGVTHDWHLDRQIVSSVDTPVIIAGGLGPENVEAAIKAVRPVGVDSKTATDRPGGSHRKDLDKVAAFVRAARAEAGDDALT
jgi:phosphoribosylanthranilate isomerase